MSKYDNSFLDTDDFIECLKRGCEVEFLYKATKYSITHIDEGISVVEYNNPSSEKIFSDASATLDCKISGKKLGEIIDKIKIIDRSF